MKNLIVKTLDRRFGANVPLFFTEHERPIPNFSISGFMFGSSLVLIVLLIVSSIGQSFDISLLSLIFFSILGGFFLEIAIPMSLALAWAENPENCWMWVFQFRDSLHKKTTEELCQFVITFSKSCPNLKRESSVEVNEFVFNLKLVIKEIETRLLANEVQQQDKSTQKTLVETTKVLEVVITKIHESELTEAVENLAQLELGLIPTES